MNSDFVQQVDGGDEQESHLELSSESDSSREFFKLSGYQEVKAGLVQDIRKRFEISEETRNRIQNCHSLMLYKDLEFFIQHIDDLYVIGTDIFNMIEIIRSFQTSQSQSLKESQFQVEQTQLKIEDLISQSKFTNMNIQEVELEAMFEEMQELQDHRIALVEGFDPLVLATIQIPDIDDSLNVVFLWCTIALFDNYKEDYYWENFKVKVFRKEAIDDFVQRLSFKKPSRMSRDQSFLASEIILKQEEYLEKKYLKKKQKDQLEKLLNFIKIIAESWKISQEIRSKVVFFDQVQKEYLELEVLQAQYSAEKLVLAEKLEQFEGTFSSLEETIKKVKPYLNPTKKKQDEIRYFVKESFWFLNQLEDQLTEVVEEQQNGEQYLIYLQETISKYFEYYERKSKSEQSELEDLAFAGLNQQDMPSILRESRVESELPLMEMNSQGQQDEGLSVPTQLSFKKKEENERILPAMMKKDNQKEQVEEKENSIQQIPNLGLQFDIEKELEEADDNNEGFDEEEDNGEQGDQDQAEQTEGKQLEKSQCAIF